MTLYEIPTVWSVEWEPEKWSWMMTHTKWPNTVVPSYKCSLIVCVKVLKENRKFRIAVLWPKFYFRRYAYYYDSFWSDPWVYPPSYCRDIAVFDLVMRAAKYEASYWAVSSAETRNPEQLCALRALTTTAAAATITITVTMMVTN